MWNANFLHLNLRPLQNQVMKTIVQYAFLLGLFLFLSWPRLSFEAKTYSPIKYSSKETGQSQNSTLVFEEDSFSSDESPSIRRSKLSTYPTLFGSEQFKLKLTSYHLHSNVCCSPFFSTPSPFSYLSLRVLRL